MLLLKVHITSKVNGNERKKQRPPHEKINFNEPTELATTKMNGSRGSELTNEYDDDDDFTSTCTCSYPE